MGLVGQRIILLLKFIQTRNHIPPETAAWPDANLDNAL